ncbi:sulfotransferase family protein [Salinibacter altiplanensis]|uniref:sulfotransferase family protein n=1 Tax=Salinibacter altiplanensis TaxID=1803181 RepID=UPI001319DA7B|nr:sulfotransferase [Salinibacter altiplanensis]
MREHPHFLIAGAPRSGTGWMLSCLMEHPEVHVPHREVDYFSYKYDHTTAWYRDHFSDCEPGQRTGEKSPSYLASSEAPDRIHDWNSDVDLIFSLRHPVERAYSTWCMMMQNSRSDLGDDIERELTPSSGIVKRGRYFEHLQRYRAHFPDEQIHVLIFDGLKADALQFARTLFEAIGVDPNFKPSLLDRKYGNRKKRGGRVWSQIQEWSLHLTRMSDTAARLMDWARRQGYTDWVHRMRLGKEYPSLPDAVRERLNKHYQDDVDRLRSYLGRDLPGWPGNTSA